MAIITKKSPIGTLSGKIADVVVTKWKGIDVVKDVPGKKSKKQKKKLSEQPQNLRLALVSSFLKNFRSALAVGFWQKNGKLPAYQKAVQYNLSHAVTGEYPDYQLDYRQLAFSTGKREMAWGCRLTLLAAQRFRVEWEIPRTAKSNLIGDDEGYILTSITREDKRNLFFVHPVKRKQLLLDVQRSRFFAGALLHAWIFFASPDGKISSRSRYLGSLTL